MPNSSGRARGILWVPFTAMAFRFFEPATAPRPGPPGRAAVVAEQPREEHPRLAGRADGEDVHARLADLGLDQDLGFVGIPPPHGRGLPDLQPVIVQPQVDRPVGLAGDPQAVVAAEAQLGAPEPAAVRLGPQARGGGFAVDGEAPHRRADGARQRPVHEEQGRGRAEGIQVFGQERVEQAGRQGRAAQESPFPFRRDGHLAGLAGGQVDFEDGLHGRLEDLAGDFAGAADEIQHGRDVAHHHGHAAVDLQLAGHHGAHGVELARQDLDDVVVVGGQDEGGFEVTQARQDGHLAAGAVPQVEVIDTAFR